MSKFFVKFVPWNEKTLSNIINKTIKFSTVYEFNDFNEYRYIGTGNDDKCFYNKAKNILEKEILSNSFLNNLQTLSNEKSTKEYKKKIASLLKEGNAKQLLNLEENCLYLLQENLAYSSVGIFCISDIDVFKDDSAQLMFAHYAKNITGTALIYEATTQNTIPIKEYDSERKISNGAIDRSIRWYNGDYKNIEDFLYKSKNWKYEKESRIFGKAGIAAAKDHNVILRAVLYTPRFSDDQTLFAINDNIYKGNLIIEEIYASHSESYFLMQKDKSKTIDFLRHTFSLDKR